MRFLISTPEELHAVLKAESRERGQTLTGFVREILWDWAKQNERSKKEDESNE